MPAFASEFLDRARLSAVAKFMLISIACIGCCFLLAVPQFYLPAEDAIILHS